MVRPFKRFPHCRNASDTRNQRFAERNTGNRRFASIESIGWILLASAVQLFSGGFNVSCSWEGSKSVFPEPIAPAFATIETSIEKGDTDIARNAEFFIRFSDRPDPAQTNHSYIKLSGGGLPVAVRRTADLVSCKISLTPFELLEPGLSHVLSISEELTSIHGATIEEGLEIHFTTTFMDPDPEQVPKPKVDDNEIQSEFFDVRCGCCHDPQTGRFNHILALEASAAVNTRSRQRPDMKLVEPGSHIYSYLLHKILGLPTIVGEPMPPKDEECGDHKFFGRNCPVEDPALRLLGDWIMRYKGG